MKKPFTSYLQYCFLLIWILVSQCALAVEDRYENSIPKQGTCNNFQVEYIKFYEDIPILWDLDKPFPVIDGLTVETDLHWHHTKRNLPNTLGYHTTQSKPVAHIYSKPLKLKVKFNVDPRITSIRVKATSKSNEANEYYSNIEMAPTRADIPCIDGRCPGVGEADFEVARIEDRIDANTLELNWELVSANETVVNDPNEVVKTSHRVYCLFDQPKGNFLSASATVLELALHTFGRNISLPNRKNLLAQIRAGIQKDELHFLNAQEKLKILDLPSDKTKLAAFNYAANISMSKFEFKQLLDEITYLEFNLKKYLQEVVTNSIINMQCTDISSLFLIFTSIIGIDDIKLALVYCVNEGPPQKTFKLWLKDNPYSVFWYFHCTPIDISEDAMVVYDPLTFSEFLHNNLMIDRYIGQNYRNPQTDDDTDEKFKEFSEPRYHILSEFFIRENNNRRWSAKIENPSSMELAIGNNIIDIYGVGLDERIQYELFLDGESCNSRDDVKFVKEYNDRSSIEFSVFLPDNINCKTVELHLSKLPDDSPEKFVFNIAQPNSSPNRESAIEFTPNPAHGFTRVSINSGSRQTVTIDLFDFLGRSILSYPADLKQGNNTLILPLSNIPKGLYRINVSSTNIKGNLLLID